jgi:hypothetical protein
MTGGERSTGAARGLIAAPLLVGAALVIYVVSNDLRTIGPFNRSQIGWFVVVPLYLLAPGALSLAWRSQETRRSGRAVLLAVAASLGLILAAGLATATTQIGCRQVTSPLEVLPFAVLMGMASALSFATPVLLASVPARRGRTGLAFVVGAGAALVGAVLTLTTYVALSSAGASCPAALVAAGA